MVGTAHLAQNYDTRWRLNNRVCVRDRRSRRVYVRLRCRYGSHHRLRQQGDLRVGVQG
jgi:hypothetical protein